MEAVHLAHEGMEVYERLEAYQVCGHGLREAYVGLKRLRHQVSGCTDGPLVPA
jgi:hypothetical protein